ncbi:Type IIB DNA topoisomerase family protein [Theileria parva strain Muguga]|uniref:Type IIB DNA topoisomerase family protein n=1 Tax=Theileria parva strain Muguga TaxID=333668 RepID=UPI001C61BCA0|nr:Type IIB DNA topoisomerase family protein [Theileria parva strain Muguga]EAN31753.2 Type IIB DNA topoisomerase family protein [Theileria parva strain Muguga]
MSLLTLEYYFLSLLQDLTSPNFLVNSVTVLQYTRVILVLRNILRNLRRGAVITLRGIYYNCAHVCQSQRDSDQIIIDITQKTKLSRKKLLISTCPKALIKGHLTLSEIFNHNQIIHSNCDNTLQGNGIAFSSICDFDIQFPYTTLNYLLIVEKETVYHRLLKFGLLEKHKPCAIVLCRGFPDHSTRELVYKIYQKAENQFPFIILTDFNPSGLIISLNFHKTPRTTSYYVEDCGIENLYWMCLSSSEKISGIKSILTSRDLKIIQNLIQLEPENTIYDPKSGNSRENTSEKWNLRPDLVHIKNSREILEKFISEGFTYQLDDFDTLELLVTHSLDTLVNTFLNTLDDSTALQTV